MPSKSKNTSTPRAEAAPPALTYEVRADQRHAHRFDVRLRIDRPAATQTVSLPVWIPGSYLVREFARHLQHLRAQQAGREAVVTQLDKHSWSVQADPALPLRLQWEVYAFDPSVRAAWLDTARAFFNPTSLCLRVHGLEHAPHRIRVHRPKGAQDWKLATALAAQQIDRDGFGTYVAADYDELADSPFEMGPFQERHFTVRGVPHRLVVSGAGPTADLDRLAQDTQRICAAAMAFWHGPRRRPPIDRYVFLLNVVDDGYGGLEHRHSTALICGRRDLPRRGPARQPEGYTTLLGLVSHEYFHTWCVKRLRPAEFTRYDYERENYTRLLWFFEGFTSYYDDLLLRRAGLIDDAAYLGLLAKSVQGVLATPGRLVQSVAQASFDAWIRYYRPDENTPNSTVSYYAKGALVALCLDLSLRQRGSSLDEVMRALWAASGGGPVDEAAIAAAVRSLGGPQVARQLREWVHSACDLPLEALLSAQGVALVGEPMALPLRLGLKLEESPAGLRIKHVLRDSAAEAGGLAPGDEWLGLRPASKTSTAKGHRPADGWRLRRADDLGLLLGGESAFVALLARDGRLLECTVQMPAEQRLWRLAIRDAQAVRRWLGGAPD